MCSRWRPDIFCRRNQRDEIRRIASYKFICEKHLLKVEIANMGNDCVRVTGQIERTLRNISSSKAPMKSLIWIDEWGFDQEKSKIIECQMELDDGTKTIADINKIRQNASISPTFFLETEEKSIEAQRSVKVYTKWSEIRRINDEISVTFTSPTRNPEIEVNAPDFDFMCDFGPLDGKIDKMKYAERQTLIGTYFPGQRMRIRFWPKGPKS